jgi:hypothetical protein
MPDDITDEPGTPPAPRYTPMQEFIREMLQLALDNGYEIIILRPVKPEETQQPEPEQDTTEGA